MFKTQTLLYLCGLAATIGSTEAFSACGDARINGAFRAAVGREPTATECNAGRFAGGAYSSETELIPLVKASLVCSDPWIAQAYYKLGRPINGHDPTQLEGGRAGSTMDQCNYSIYGSWSNFPQLVQLVQNRATPAAPAAAGAAVSATITGPATLASAQSATVTWAFTGAPTACGSGVDLVMNGGGMQNYTMARIPNLGARSLSFQMLDWSRSFTTDTAVTLQLVDKCLGRPISASYSTKITVVQALAAGRVRVTLDGGLAVVLNLLQRILDTDGNLFDQNNVRVGSGYYLDAAGALKSPAGLVASGGGNLVASGGGNLVASGGGNVVALPDFRLQSAPDRIVRGLGGDGHLIDSRGLRVLPAGNANRIQYGVLIGGAGGALVASGGGNIVQTAVGGPMSIITMDPAHLQQVLAGRAAVGSIVASGIIGPPRTAPMQVLSVGGPVTVTQFSPAASTWANRSGLVVQWNFAGAAPADQRVIVQYQVGGRSYMGCPAMPISNRSCQIPGADFAPLLRTTTAGTLSLLDGATQRLLMTAPMTIRIP